MFTGLISHIGTVASVQENADDRTIWVKVVKGFLDGLILGSSVSVNGVCLTVTGLKATQFSVDVSAETLRCTSLRQLIKGSRVNLEHCLTLQKPLGGHLVSGHVLDVGTIVGMKKEGHCWVIEIEAPKKVMDYIAPKGCVAIDGVSMTVNCVASHSFFINVIPHTFEKTIFSSIKMGDRVNLEVDMIMLYLDHLLKGNGADPTQVWGAEILASWVHTAETEH
ncbi:MAG: riboflavin synthase [Gammaproteobacteria bacterium]